jgi:hypothetical protein
VYWFRAFPPVAEVAFLAFQTFGTQVNVADQLVIQAVSPVGAGIRHFAESAVTFEPKKHWNM